jgi:hypothetical protein
MIGLFAFFYGCLHLTTYVAADQFFDVSAIVEDIAKRRFIAVGFAVFRRPPGRLGRSRRGPGGTAGRW